jgi:hypothetical protein
MAKAAEQAPSNFIVRRRCLRDLARNPDNFGMSSGQVDLILAVAVVM